VETKRQLNNGSNPERKTPQYKSACTMMWRIQWRTSTGSKWSGAVKLSEGDDG
jgi:hypothetical protein